MKPTSLSRIAGTLAVLIVVSCNRKPDTPESFRIESGFRLTLVAREPLVKDPVDLAFDENGNAYALEMPGYPLEDKESIIVSLRDADNDGEYDGHAVYAENLRFATSILPWRNGMLVAAPPCLLYLKDTDGDGRADQRDTLMAGFAMENLQHNFNGLTYGIDNWIYIANGGNSGKPFWWRDSTSAVDLRGQDLRINLDKKIMERIGESSGGFGLAMDNFGRLFETHNLNHVSQLVIPGRYIVDLRIIREHTLKNISNHEENGLARIYPIGEQESRVNHPEQSGYFSGACGIAFYSGGGFGQEFENSIWVADVVLNLVHVDKIIPDGASLAASRILDKRDFLASSDRSFRPVNTIEGPDGALYVVDMYRRVIEHPEWIPDEIEKDLDLSAGSDQGRIYKISKKGSASQPVTRATPYTTERLIADLSSDSQWTRMTAHRLLMESPFKDRDYVALRQALKSGSAMKRLHGMWILQAKESLTAADVVPLMNDSVAGIRENALIAAETLVRNDPEVFERCLELCVDKDQRVRMQAALTLSTCEKQRLSDASRDVIDALAAAAELQTDEWNTIAITAAARHFPAALFARMITEGDENRNAMLLASLALTAGGDAGEVAQLLDALGGSRITGSIKAQIIDRLTDGLGSGVNQNTVLASIRDLERTADAISITSLASLRKKLKLSPSPEFVRYSKSAAKTALDESIPDSVRLASLRILDHLPFGDKSDILFRSIHHSQPLQIQEEAMRQLGSSNDVSVGYHLVRGWKDLGPGMRRKAGDILLYNKVHHDALLTGLETGAINIGEMNFDLERRRMLLWWTDNERTKRRASALFSDAGVVKRRDAIERMKPSLSLKGVRGNGEKVFTAVCGQCHRYGTTGNDVGPVLTEISRKSKETLLHDILDPNAAADPKFISHRVETSEGQVHIGIIDSETDRAITLKKTGGEVVTIEKSAVKTLSSLGTSLMPEGLESSITHQEMADLLAFLTSG